MVSLNRGLQSARHQKLVKMAAFPVPEGTRLQHAAEGPG